MNCRRKRSWSLLVLFSALMICEGFVKVESQHDYADALSKSILFFEGQRSGKLPSNQRMNWRKDSALEDGRQMGVSVRFPLSAFHFPRRVLLFFFSPLWFVKQTSGRQSISFGWNRFPSHAIIILILTPSNDIIMYKGKVLGVPRTTKNCSTPDGIPQDWVQHRKWRPHPVHVGNNIGWSRVQELG